MKKRPLGGQPAGAEKTPTKEKRHGVRGRSAAALSAPAPARLRPCVPAACCM